MAEDPQDLYVGDEEGGCHHYRDPATCEDCKQEEAEARYLATVVDRLGGEVEAALSALGKAKIALRELTGDLYDIELVEGLAGDDLLAGIKDAERSLRGAERIIDWRKRLLDGKADRWRTALQEIAARDTDDEDSAEIAVRTAREALEVPGGE